MTAFAGTGARTTALLTGTSGVQTLGDVGLNGGRVRVVCDTVETVAVVDTASTLWMARLPSNARILHTSQLSWDDLATAGSPVLGIGTFNPSGRSGITDNSTSLNASLDLATATAGKAFLADFVNTGKRLWELAGATSDPKQMIDIIGTFSAAATTTVGTISWAILYTVD